MPNKPLPSDVIWDDELPQGQSPQMPAGMPTAEMEALKPSFPMPQFIKQSTLPMGLSIAGGAGAPFIGLPPVVGQSIGGGVGEGLNQLLGITEPSIAQIGINASMPLIFAGGAGLIRKGAAAYAKRTGVGRIIGQQEAVAAARRLPDIIETAASEPIYKELAKQNVDIPVDTIVGTINKLSQQERIALEGQKIPALNRILKGFSAKIRGTPDKFTTSPILDPRGKPIIEIIPGEPGGKMTFQELWTSIKRIGSRIDDAQGAEKGALKKIYGSLWDDLRNASEKLSPELGDMLKTANTAYRREMAKSDLAQQVIKAINPQAGTGYEFLNAKQLLNWFNKSPDSEFFQKSLKSFEVKEIKNVLHRLIKVASLPPPVTTPIGSGRVLATKLAQSGVTGGITQTLTGNPATSAMVGAITPLIIEDVGHRISEALMTEGGRKFLLKAISSGAILDHKFMGLLGEFLATQIATPKSKTKRLEQDINYRSIPSIVRPGPNIQHLPSPIGVE